MDRTRKELEAEHDALKARKVALDSKIHDLKCRLSPLREEVSEAERRIAEIKGELRRREACDSMVPTISDHALLRYIERVCGVSIEELKAELLTDTVVLAIKSGATAVRSPAGTMVIRGNTVVTFMEGSHGRKRKPVKDSKQQEAD